MLKHSSYFIALSALLIIFNGCCKDKTTGPTPQSDGKPIQFNDLAVGQTSSYLGLLGEKYFESSTDDFVYTDDTLVLTIVSKDAMGYKIKEELRYVGDVDSWMGTEKDSIYYYYLEVKNDTLMLHPSGSTYLQSRIFQYPISSLGLPLADITNPKVQIGGWKTDLPYCECRQSGYAENYSLFGAQYTRLNVIIDNSPMALDGAGTTYAFSPEDGIVRFSTYGWWTQSGFGWDLIPKK